MLVEDGGIETAVVNKRLREENLLLDVKEYKFDPN